jgi:hypothetical protein
MSYLKHSVHLTNFQLNKLKTAAKHSSPVSIDLDPQKPANFELYLTQRQINKLKKGIPTRLNISKSQIKRNGGFLFSVPAIIAGIGALAGVTSAASAVAKSINAKKHQSKTETEQHRHNLEMEKLLKSKSGLGAYLPSTLSKAMLNQYLGKGTRSKGCNVKKNSSKPKA